MKRRLCLLLLISIFFSVTLVSAEIILSQPSSIYNLGDILDIEAKIKPSQQLSGFFELNLNCGNGSTNFYRESLNLKPEDVKKISSSFALTKSLLSDILGECRVEAKFLSEFTQTQNFIVSDGIDVSISIENMSIYAGEETVIKGTAIKKNGEPVNGFVKLSVEGLNISSSSEVVEGNFEAKLQFPSNVQSRNYVINARVYEEYMGVKTNIGENSLTLNIKRNPTKLDVALSKQNVIPGESLIFKPIIYDQAGEEILSDVSVKIYDSHNNIFFQEIMESGGQREIFFETNQSPGYWKINAESLGLNAERLFFVEELEKAKFEVINDTLIITNIGNVEYKKAVQVSIGEIPDVQNLGLDLGESKKFRLAAPDGAYNVKITDGDSELSINEVTLTGKIVGIKEMKGKLDFTGKYPVIWILLIIIVGIFVLLLLQRISKKKFYGAALLPKQKPKTYEEKQEKKSKNQEIIGELPVKRAEHSLVLHGKKANTAVLTIRIKDLNDIRKTCKETVNSVLKMIAQNNGAIYETSDYIIGIFSPATTKTFKNEMLVVKLGGEISEVLKKHNRKFKQKIDYGISLNSGDLIVKDEKNKLKFTGLGNVMNLAKKIASLAKEEILMSDFMQKRIMSEIKTDKEIRQGVNVHHIKSIIDRDRNKKFIQDFLKRLDAGDVKKANPQSQNP